MTMPIEPVPASTSTPVPAAPVAPTPPMRSTAPDEPQYFTRDQVMAAREEGRKEANDRLYGRITQGDERFDLLKKEVEDLRSAKQKADDEAAAAAKAAEEAAEAQRLSEMTAVERLEATQKDWDAKFTALQEESDRKDALLRKEREIGELRAYRDRRVAEEAQPQTDAQGVATSDGIAPQLIDYITGNSEAEIEQAITNAKAKTTSILEGIRQARTVQMANAPGVSVNAGNVGPLDNLGPPQEFTAEQINAMAIDDPRLLQLRERYGIGRAAPQQGMFPNTRAFG